VEEGEGEEEPDIIIDEELLLESENQEIPEEPVAEDGPEAAFSEEAFENDIVLDEPDLDELEGELDVDAGFSGSIAENDSFDSQEFDVSFEPSLEEEVDELASSDETPGVSAEDMPAADGIADTAAEVSEETAGLRETDFEDINVDDITLDQDVISLDFTEDDLPDIEDDLQDDETLQAKDAEELQVLREEGARPMTEAPEDTTYLEEDPLAAEQIDLSGAIIDEPDLSGDITENPVEEPSLENISLDLDLEELDEGLDETLDETLESEELEPEEESFAQVIPEGFVVEADDSQSSPALDTGDSFQEEDLDMLEGGQDIQEEERGIEDAAPEIPAAKEETEEAAGISSQIPSNIKNELKTVLSYMDQLLESLPEEKIEEFAKSEYFETYKKLFEELGLV
jgi:hypothetical protein